MEDVSTERFLAVLTGGPFPGEYLLPAEVTWPLPKFILAKDTVPGAYVKNWESTGKAKSVTERRGARYSWDEKSAGYDLSN